MAKILLIGGGGHCKVLIDAILACGEHTVVGIIEVEDKNNRVISGIPVIGSDRDLQKYRDCGIINCLIAVGSVGDCDLRVRLAEKAAAAGFSFPIVIHPQSVVSPFAALGAGTFVAPAAVINAGATVGEHCIINTAAIVEHDCTVGDFVHVASGALLSGDVCIGERSHIGTGSAVIQGVKIGGNTIIGAGSAVVSDMPNNVLAYGNPCRGVRVRDE